LNCQIENAAGIKFGRYGGLFVPETLVQPLLELAEAYEQMKNSDEFHRELTSLLKNFAGRPTPLYYARNLSLELGARST